jgi:5-methylcytosine-specific restriction endonuclease McrA
MSSSFYGTLRWQAARAAALARDEYRCTAEEAEGHRCAETARLNVHHVHPVDEGGEAYELTNLVTLCPSHHTKLHWLVRENDLERDLARWRSRLTQAA